jgi:hypothetical protein
MVLGIFYFRVCGNWHLNFMTDGDQGSAEERPLWRRDLRSGASRNPIAPTLKISSTLLVLGILWFLLASYCSIGGLGGDVGRRSEDPILNSSENSLNPREYQ